MQAIYDNIDYALQHRELDYHTEYNSEGICLYMGYGDEDSMGTFVIYGIWIEDKNKGTLRSILKHIFSKVDKLYIAAVTSQIMNNICLHYKFICKGGDFLCTKDNFIAHSGKGDS